MSDLGIPPRTADDTAPGDPGDELRRAQDRI